MRIAICEDDKMQQQELEALILSFSLAESIELIKFDSGEELIEAYRKNQRFSIILLDMQMDGLDGIQTAKIVRKYDKNCPIIIITAIMEYAIKGYSIDAYDFILKPVKEEKFKRILSKVVKEIQVAANKVYVIQTRDKTSVLKLIEIIYIESDKKE